MRELFRIDTGDYRADGKRTVRNSSRGIAVRDDKVLLVHSELYNYYKFPGGGIEEGEDRESALIREFREETGYEVIPESIEEYGSVMRVQKDTYDPDGVFEQDNFYYFCRITEKAGETKLDGYEAMEGFTPVWIEPLKAAFINRYESREGADRVVAKREAKVLEMLDTELMKRDCDRREREAVASLGDPAYLEMLDFVHQRLGDESDVNSLKDKFYYDRFAHVKRVLGWAKRFYDECDAKEEIRYEELIIGTIFHDVGRGSADLVSHAQAGAVITREYLTEKGFDPERTDYICSLVARHSDKHLMSDSDIDKTLLMLMEADLADDMGALGIVMDCMITESRNDRASFFDCYHHITRYTQRIQEESNPMVTPWARKCWDEKTGLVNEFMDHLGRDILLHRQ